MGKYIKLIRDSAKLLNKLVEDELDLALKNSRNVAEDTTPGKGAVFYLVGPSPIYEMYEDCLLNQKQFFSDSSFPRRDSLGRERFYAVLMMARAMRNNPRGDIRRSISREVSGGENEGLFNVAVALSEKMRKRGIDLSEYNDNYPAANNLGRRICVFFLPTNILQGYRRDIGEVFSRQQTNSNKYNDTLLKIITEFAKDLNYHMDGTKTEEGDTVRPKAFMFMLNHEITHFYIALETEGVHNSGPVEEGFAQFTDSFLEVKKKMWRDDGHYIRSDEGLYEGYEDKGYSEEFINWTVQILQEKYWNYEDREELEGSLDEFREDAVDFYDSNPEGPEDFFRFMMPEEIKSEVEKVEKIIEHDIDQPLMTFLNEYKNNNQAPPGFLQRAGIKNEEEIKSAVYSAQKFKEIVLRKMVVNAIDNKEGYGFYEDELDKMIREEAKEIIDLVESIETLQKVLRENGHDWPELKEITNQLEDAEKELEQLDQYLNKN